MSEEHHCHNQDPHKMAAEISEHVRKTLQERIGDLPDDILIEFGGGPRNVADIIKGEIRTDWPDSFDRNTWYKTWAKSGAESLPSEVIVQRALLYELQQEADEE